MNGDFRLAGWLVQPGLNSISQGCTSRRLEPKVMEILVCLARYGGQTLSKEQLLQTGWPDTFVSDDVLVRGISELRRAFEDDVHDSRVIQTIPKRGYRLVAPIQPMNDVLASDVPATLDTAAPVPGKLSWKLGVVAAAAVPFLLLALVQADAWRRGVGQNNPPEMPSLAVLPLQNLSPDPGEEYFADAITEELIAEFSRRHALKVIPRTSVRRYKNTDKRIAEIARELGVDGIVEGSVLRSGDRVRITVQLIRAPGDAIVWAQIYDGNLGDVLALETDVASAVANEVGVRMTHGEQPRRLVDSGLSPM